MFALRSSHFRKGTTLIEIIVAAAIFSVLSIGVYQGYVGVLDLVRVSRTKVTAANLANEQFEIARNMPYSDVGIVAGLPSGTIPHTQTLVRDGISFTVTSSVKAIDEAFDGLIGSGDTSFAPDSKLLEVNIECALCRNFTPITFTTRVSPKAIEGDSTNGAIRVQVFDANGLPVSNARVEIVNGSVSPAVAIDEETNIDGELLVTDVPPSANGYAVTVSKTGYSSDRTYALGDPGNPNPAVPHATIVSQQLTQVSFLIDRVSTVNISSVRSNCAAVSGIDFNMVGAKIIGTDALGANIYKYDEDHLTGAGGTLSLPNLEWDTYTLTTTDGGYDLGGTMSPLPISLAPNATQEVTLVMEPKNPQELLVSVKDSATGLPVTGALVDIGAGIDPIITGRGFLTQTDWSGGSGQEEYTNQSMFWSSDGNIDGTTLPGTIRLLETFGFYAPSGTLESSTFDTGSASASNFYEILWQPTNQPVETGTPNVRLQFATSDEDEGPWSFTGPDGTGATYYALGSQTLWSGHNGDRRARYKVFLDSALNTATPSLSDISFTFTSSCVPPGQAFFPGLSNGTYTLTVTKAGYQAYSEDVLVDSAWKHKEVMLLSE